MSDFHIYIKMPSYLRQWFVHRHSGSEPVRLRKGSIESKLIKLAIVRPPETALPKRQQADEVAICIPYSMVRDPRTYNHITETGKRAFLENIKNSFDVDCWTFLHDFGKIGKQQKDLIYLYMEQRGIKEDGTCWDAIAKVYQRLRKNYLTNQCKKKNATTKSRTSYKVENSEFEE